MLNRRYALIAAAVAVAIGGVSIPAAHAADKVFKIGVEVSLTGADAQEALLVKNGALLAIDEANDPKDPKHIKGIKFEAEVLDDGTATAGQYDPAQGATNARKFVSDKGVIAAVGPEMSGVAKAMLPILSTGNLAIITPSATNPDMTDPKLAAQYRPAGKPVFFRTVATDAYQGPNMANYYANVLKAKSVYVLDDSGAYGEGIADAFQAQAEKKGIKVLGRDKLDPKAADYTAVLTKIKSLNPDSLYYGGVMQAGVKLIKQAYDILPHSMIKGGGDGLVTPEMLTAVGEPANQGWYATQASPHVTEEPEVASWVKKYTTKFKVAPDDYAVTSYDGAVIIIDAVKRLHAAGKPITRDTVRDAIQAANLKTLQGPVQFDENGDMISKTITVYQVKHADGFPADDTLHQFPYIAVAPES